ncbi:MAG: thioredoxin [Chloroflexi bacterium]|nr:thioredoxin [Chloroflexota bacterium]|tara:strand:- start:20 stop:352 length:333 start_codon:yes stop_codon:yes gene_type:complete
MSNAKKVTDQNFNQEVIESSKPVLVDFWAEWCGPCKMIAPSLEELANDYKDTIDVVKLNVDENPTTASSFSIRSIPTLLIFKDGAPVSQIVGAVPKSAIKSKIDEILEKS